MKRMMEVLWPVIGLCAVALASWLLYKELRGLAWADVKAGLLAIPLSHWGLAILASLLAYAALAWYDQIALRHLGHKLSFGFIALVSFTTYSLSHNIGASVFSGALVRYRAYSTKGLSAAEVGILVAFCSFTFFLGTITLGGLSLLIHPDILTRLTGGPAWAGFGLGVLMLAAVALYAAGSLLHFEPLKIGSFQLVYPRPPIAARQFLAAPLELIGAAGIIYFALPETANPGYIMVLGIFLGSFSLALLSHAPGGLGVLEFSFINALPEAPKAEIVAALLVFRLLYLVLPLIFALVVVALFERANIAALLRPRGEG